MINSNPPKGMRDLLPAEVELRNEVIRVITGVYRRFGFTQIETPSVEDIRLLSSGEGGENEKMLFKILKRGEKLELTAGGNENDLVDLGLRYDLTVPLCRFFANNRAKLPANFKVIQIGSVWRAERPQKGRFRQFTQCDIDIIGVKSAMAEIELILATSEALLALQFEQFTVRINDRRILESLATTCGFPVEVQGRVFVILDKLDKIGIDGMKQELLDSEFDAAGVEKLVELVAQATAGQLTIENLQQKLPGTNDAVIRDLQLILDIVRTQAGAKYSIQFDLSLVRGMGYYTGPIFEVSAPGYKSSIAGGGRYDRMIGKILQSKEEVPACGFSIGFERVISILMERNFRIQSGSQKIVVLYPEGLTDISELLKQVTELRENGNVVNIEAKKKSVSTQLARFEELGYEMFGLYNSGEALVLKNFDKSVSA